MPKTTSRTKPSAKRRQGTVPKPQAGRGRAASKGANAAGGAFEQGQSGSNTSGAKKKKSTIRRTGLKAGRPDWIDETERDTEDRIAIRKQYSRK